MHAIPAPSHTQTVEETPAENPASPAPRPVDVVLVDDNIHTSYSVWTLLRWRPGVRVLGSFAPTEEASAVIAAAQPHVCLVSAVLGSDYIRALKQLPDAPPVLLYAKDRDSSVDASALASAETVVWRYADPVSRYADPNELIHAIQVVADQGEGEPRHELAGAEADEESKHGGAS